jgi:hypothetical protein
MVVVRLKEDGFNEVRKWHDIQAQFAGDAAVSARSFF